jgi:hypothetical protein
VTSFSRKPQGKYRQKPEEGFCGTAKSHIAKEGSSFESRQLRMDFAKGENADG